MLVHVFPGIGNFQKKNAYIFRGTPRASIWSRIHVPQEHMVGLCTFCAADAQPTPHDRRERSSYMQMCTFSGNFLSQL